MLTRAKLRKAVLSIFESIEIPITLHELFIEIRELGGYREVTKRDLKEVVQPMVCAGRLQYTTGLKIRKP